MNTNSEFTVVEVVYSYSIASFELSEEAVKMYLYRRRQQIGNIRHTRHETRHTKRETRPRVYCMCYGCVIHSRGQHIERNDPILVGVVKDLGEKAAGDEVQLLIAEAVEGFYYVSNFCGCSYGCGLESIKFKGSSNLREVNGRASALHDKIRNSDVVSGEIVAKRKKIHEERMLNDREYANDYNWGEYEMLAGGRLW